MQDIVYHPILEFCSFFLSLSVSLFLSLPFWAVDPKGTMSYWTEGGISVRPSERTSEQTSEQVNVQVQLSLMSLAILKCLPRDHDILQLSNTVRR